MTTGEMVGMEETLLVVAGIVMVVHIVDHQQQRNNPLAASRTNYSRLKMFKFECMCWRIAKSRIGLLVFR